MILTLPFAALHFVESSEDGATVTSLIEDLSEEEDGEGNEKGTSNFDEPILVREPFYVIECTKRLEKLAPFSFNELNLISKVVHIENSTPPPEFV